MDHKAIIETLGAQRVAEFCGIRENAVANWKSRGRIPPLYWADIVDMFAELDQPLDFKMLRNGHKTKSSGNGI